MTKTLLALTLAVLCAGTALAQSRTPRVGLDYTGRMRALSHPVGGIAATRNEFTETFGEYDPKPEKQKDSYGDRIEILKKARQGINPKNPNG